MRNLSPLGARFSKPSQGFGPTGTLQRPGLRSHAGAWDRSDSTASNDFVWCARRTLPLHAEFATAWDTGLRFGVCRNDLMIGGPGLPLLPVGDDARLGLGGRWSGPGWWHPGDDPSRSIRRRLSPASHRRGLSGFLMARGLPVGEGVHPHRATPGPPLS